MSRFKRSKSMLRAIITGEASGGLLLMGAAALALIVANSPLASQYFGALQSKAGGMSVLHWINDGLMALFFLLVGLEIKREFLDGELASWRRRALPGLAALGGMIAPALVYVAINWQTPETLKGWAIPTATDIAFALGTLALLGSRVPASLKVFLTALAILDDLGAVLVIALFYTAEISLPMLAGMAATMAALIALNASGVKRLWPYLLLGAILWVFTLKSGVHATIAGILLALTIPIRATPGAPEAEDSPLHRLEHALHGWSAYFIVPVFGFANAGVSLAGISMESLAAPVTLGIASGLFLGKMVGVFSFSLAAIRLGIAQKPAGATPWHLLGAALLCGIGFTMSLFISLLAFASSGEWQDEAKIGTLLGSLISGLAGAAVLLVFTRPARRKGKS